MNKNQKPKELQDLDACLASLENVTKELKACMDSPMNTGGKSNPIHDKINSLADSMYASMASLRNTMYNLHDSHAKKMSDHMDASSHLPPITGPGKMQACLAKLGLDDDYEVHKKPIFASSSYASTIKAGKHGIKVELDLNRPKN